MKKKKVKQNSNISGVAKVLNHLTTIIAIILVVLAIMLVGFRLIGFDTYVVLSGSMEPAHKTGSLIYAKEANTDELKVGDVITFRSQGSETIVTHRIIDVEESDSGRNFTTKGDANNEADAQPVTETNVIGKVAFSIPYMGYVANYIQNPPGLYFAAAGGVIVILLMFITDMLIEEDKKTRKKGKKVKEEGGKSNGEE